jgi:hypothetical protein
MKILDRVDISGSMNLASNAKDTFTIGTPLENNDGNVDTLYVHANAYLNNHVVLGSSSVDTVVFNGLISSSIIPAASASYSLGSSDKPFKEIFVGSGSISIASPFAGVISTVISNNSGNLDISAGGVRIVGAGSFVGNLQATASHAATASSYYNNIAQAGGNDGTTFPIAYGFSSNSTGKSVNILSLKQGTNIVLSQATGNLTVDVDQTAWQTYTPTWTATTTNPTLGNGTLTGAYKQIGKTVFVRVKLSWGSTTTGGSGDWRFSLPVTAASADGIQFPCTMLDNGVHWYEGTVNGTYANNTTYSAIIAKAGNQAHSDGVNATSPFNWGSADSLQFNGSYEAA